GSDKDKDKDRDNGGSSSSGGGGKDSAQSVSLIVTGQSLVRAQFTTTISKRYPANEVSLLDDPHQAVSYFTEVTGMQGHTITHRWSYRGEVVYETSFKINGPKWRFWSTQVLPADKTGTWHVEVIDNGNKILQTSRLDYRPVG
ncbi:MAG: DUF2914 domain-containing protein, partial [Alphaproteobacteria bacterium]|nr:DUF2914 domain-containing protein [Alphaproteobacteria bacterium]